MTVPAKLPFSMGFKKIKQFLKKLMSWFAPRGLKLPKIVIFLENGLFSVIITFNQLVECPLIYYWKELLKL